MKIFFTLFFSITFLVFYSQESGFILPSLIPKKMNEKIGYVNQSGKFIIAPEYHIAMFFYEDCNLENSPNKKVRVFGSSNFATVEKNYISYRIDKKGTKVYRYKDSDLGTCRIPYEEKKYKIIKLEDLYGLLSSEKINLKYDQEFDIYPEYQMLTILESDRESPMIVAVKENKFGVVDKTNSIIIPFIYEDIKTNFSWKIANLFEVSFDGVNYFYVDKNNVAY